MGLSNLFPINGMIFVTIVFILILFIFDYIILNKYILKKKNHIYNNIDINKYDVCLNCGSAILKIHDKCPNCGSYNIKRF